MTTIRHNVRHTVLVALLILVGCRGERDASWLGPAQAVAPGVELYRTADESLVGGVGPVAVSLLRLDPALVRIDSVLSNDEVADAETVADIARRHGALAAVNGGFFNAVNGEPTGVLMVAGELVSDASAAKGAVVIETPSDGPMQLAFDRVSVKMTLHFTGPDGTDLTVPIDGVDTTRERGRLMLYTPAYHEDTDTAPTGTEWRLDGDPLRVVEVRSAAGHTLIPAGGAVLSFGGVDLPEPLDALEVGTTVGLETTWRSRLGVPVARYERASHVVSGAGLLRSNGDVVDDWSAEGLSLDDFVRARHPRTLVGIDGEGYVWLAAVDGRQPDYSIGMHFDDLQRLADRLGLHGALNLDGGGSTTMVVDHQIVNRPSDLAGPRPVGDALLVIAR